MTANGQSVCAVLVTIAEDEDFRATLNAVLNQGHSRGQRPARREEKSPLLLDSSQGERPQPLTPPIPHAASAPPPTVQLIVVDASDRGVIAADSLPEGVHLYHARAASNFGRAVDEALRSQHLAPLVAHSHFLWLLHADSTPEADCLEHLLSACHAGTTIAVVGPKLVDATGSRALAVGINATRSARRQETSLPEEIDQGQHDGRVDVLAVSTAGMLVTMEAWTVTGGLDPLLGPYGDGLEFGRRVRRLGYRVVVCAKARVVHHRRTWQAQENITPVLRARTYNWLMAAPAWQLPFLVVYAVLAGPIRALIFAVAGQLGRAWSEALTGLYVLSDSAHLVARRLWIHRRAQVPRHALSGLELPSRALRERRRELRRGIERLHGTEVSPALAAAVRVHRARTLVGAAIIFGLLSVIAIVMWTPLLGGVAGGAWAQLPSSWVSLWEAAWTPWIPGGDGHPGLQDPAIVILAFLTAPAALFGVSPHEMGPWFLALSLPAAGLAGWTLASTLTLRVGARAASALVWASLPALTLSVTSGRLTAVLFHIALPLALAAWLKLMGVRFQRELAGELSSVISPSRTRIRWWGPAALGTGVLAGLVPASFFFILLIVCAVSCALLFGRRRGLRATTAPLGAALARAWIAFIPAALLVLPSAVTTLSRGGTKAFLVSMTSAGPSRAYALPAPWELLVGTPQRYGVNPGVSLNAALWWVLVAPAALIAVWALARAVYCTAQWAAKVQGLPNARWYKPGGPVEDSAVSELWRYWMPPIALMTASVMILCAYGMRFIPAGLSDDGSPAYAWPAAALSAAGACFLIAVCAPTGQTVAERRLYQGLAGVCLVTLITSVSVTQGMVTLPLGDRIHAIGQSALPAASIHAQESSRQARVLYVDPRTEPIRLRVFRGHGPLITDSSALLRYEELYRRTQEGVADADLAATDPAWSSLASAALTTMTSPDLASVVALAEHGIDAIVIVSPESEGGSALARSLDRAPGMERGAESGAGASWRVRPHGLTPARAILVPEEQSPSDHKAQNALGKGISLDSHGQSVSGYAHEAGRLHLAERASKYWVLRANGEILPPTSHEWAQTWSIPAEADLRITYEVPGMTAWKWLLVTCVLIALAACIPGGRKK